MYKYEIFTIAVPIDQNDDHKVQRQFYEFLNDNDDLSGLTCSVVLLELENKEDITKVLENYIKGACKESGFIVK